MLLKYMNRPTFMIDASRNGSVESGRPNPFLIKAASVAIVALFAVACFVCLNVDDASADADSGSCGENLQWEFDGDHTLSITGTGPMNDYELVNPGWVDYYNTIETVTIGEGVTSIGSYAFSWYTNLAVVNLPSTLVSIGGGAFNNTAALTSLTLPNSVASVGERAFEDSGLESLTIGTGLTTIGDGAFTNGNLASITVDAGNTAFKSVDNVLLSKDGKVLYKYAPQRAGADYTVPDGVETIIPNAVSSAAFLNTLTLSASVTSFAYSYMPKLTAFDVDGGNATYQAIDGVLYSLDGTTLVQYPGAVSGNFTVPNIVVTIADDAFHSSKIGNVTLGTSLTTIGNRAFANSNISDISFNESLSSIGEEAFSSCSSLRVSLMLPESLSTLESQAFNSSGLLGVTVNGDGNLVIGPEAFASCNSLSNVTIGSGVKSIDNNAFAHSDVQTLTFEEGVVSIGNYAFTYTNITELDIPDSLRSIGSHAFFGCDGLTELTIPNGVTTLGDRAFEGCDNIETLTIGTGVTTVGSYVFSGIPALSTVNYNATACLDWNSSFSSNDESESADITLTIGANVEVIPEDFFKQTSRLKSLSIPATVKSIKNSAFMFCNGLTEVTIPEGLETIGEYAFGYCANVTTVTISSTVTSIGSGAFRESPKIATVNYKPASCETDGSVFYTVKDSRNDTMQIVFGSGVTSIPDDIFSFTYLSPVFSIPQGIVSIGESAFLSCYTLTSVTIPSSVTSIGESAFESCEGLTTVNYNATSCADMENGSNVFSKHALEPSATSIIFGATVDHIPAYLLSGATHVDSVTIPEGVESIGEYAFFRTGVSALTIPKSVTSIEEYAIYQCSSLATLNFNAEDCISSDPIIAASNKSVPLAVVFGDDVLSVPQYMLCSYVGPISVTFGSSVATIGQHAFDGCVGLTSINLPGTLTSIGQSAFRNCSSITSLTIPQSITAIEGSTFLGCLGLQSITIPRSVASIGDYAFSSHSFYDADGSTYLGQTPQNISGYVFKKVDTKMVKCRYGFVFEVNGGDDKPDYYGIPGHSASVSDPVRTHYTFAGWYSDSELQTPYEITVIPDSEEPITPKTLYAKWDPVTYTVTFDLDGGSPAIDPVEVTYPNPVSEPEGTFTKTGYHLAEDPWRNGLYVYDFDAIVDRDITLTAQWVGNDYTITLEGGAAEDGEVSVKYFGGMNDGATGVGPIYGYTLTGYFTESVGGIMVITDELDLVLDVEGYTNAGGKWIRAENVTLYAQWGPNTYGVSLFANGGDENGQATFTFGSATVTGFTPVTKAGYTCTGYYVGPASEICILSAAGVLQPDTDYTDGEGNWTVDNAVNLYAKWEPNTVAITLNGNGYGSTGGAATATYASSNISITAAAVRPGWTLTGYYSAAVDGDLVLSVNGLLASSTPYTDEECKWTGTDLSATLYAHWDPLTYTVELGGVDTTGFALVRSGDTKFSDIVAPTYRGHHVASYATTDNIPVEIADGSGNLLPNVAGFTNSDSQWIYTESDSVELLAQWLSNTYNIVLKRNGGLADGTATVDFGSDEAEITLPVARTGYELTGYYIGSIKVIGTDGSLMANVTDYTDSDGYWIRDEGATFTAGWNALDYTVTLNKNRGDGENVDVTVTFDSAVVDGYSTISRTGYALTGYFTAAVDGVKVMNADGTLVAEAEDYTSEGKWIMAEDSVLYAQWAAKEYSIVLDSNGGTANGSATATYDAGLTDIEGATFTGYSIAGYYTAASEGTKVVNANGTLVSNVPGYTDGDGKWIRDENTRLYAEWTANEYTVTYNANGGEVDSATDTFTFGTAYNLQPATHATLNFAGWKDPQGNIVASSGTWGIASNVTLTAQWSETVTYELRFTAGNAGATGQPFSMYVGAGTIQLPDGSDVFSLTGNDFTGWSDGVNLYQVGADYQVTGNVTFMAGWQVKSYWVTYLVDGGTVGGAYQPLLHNYGSAVTVLPAFDKPGYDVTAWATEDVAVIDGGFTMPGNDVVFRATSTAKTYTVTLDKNGGEANGSAVVTFDSSAVASYIPVGRTGYTLLGYYSGETMVIDAEGVLAQNAEGFTEDGKWAKVGDAELQARWQAMSQAIVLDKNTGDTNGTATVTFDSSDVTAFTAATKTGYTLNGFFTAASEGTMVMNADGTLVANISGYTDAQGKWVDAGFGKLYAQWTAIPYTITLVRNGGDTDGTATVTYGATSAVITLAPTWIGYSVDYYIVPASGDGVMNADGTLVADIPGYTDSNGRWIGTEDVSLATLWVSIDYDLVLDKNGGDTDGSAKANYGYNSFLPMFTNATKAHYDLIGYYTAASDGEEVASADGKFVKGVGGYTDSDGKWIKTEGCTLYAHWQIQSHLVTIHYVHADSSTAAPDNVQIIEYGAQYNTSSPSITGYSPDVSVVSGNMGDTDVVTTVTYTVNQYTITFNSNGGTAVAPITQDYNTAVSAPAAPTRDGYAFSEWQKAGVLYQFTTMPAEDITLDAVWHTVPYTITYELSGGTNSPSNPASYNIETPTFQFADATRTGYDFGGWYSDSGYTSAVTQVAVGSTGNIELYAKWIPKVYALILNSTGTDGSANVTFGSAAISNLVDAVVTGYNVIGYNTEGGTLVIDAERHLVASVEGYTDANGKWIRSQGATLTAVTEVQVRTLTINYEYSAGVPAAVPFVGQFQYGQAYNVASPAVTGYSPGDVAVTGTMDVVDIVVSVLYTVNTYTVRFDGNGGSPAGVLVDVEYGSPITNVPDDPVREGFVFKGWDPAIPETMPASDLTLMAVWSAKPVSPSAEVIEFDDPKAETVVIDLSIPEVVEALNNGSKTEVDLKGDGWVMEIPKTIITGASGNVSASAKALSEADKKALPAEVKELVKDKAVFSLNLSDSNGAVTFVGSKIRVTLPYELKDGEDPKHVKVFYIDGSKAVGVDTEYDADKGTVTFETDHFSTWFVDVVSDDSGSGGSKIGLIIGIIVGVLVVAAVVTVVVLMKTGKIGGKTA